MSVRLVAAVALMGVLASPSLAAEFYVVQDVKTKKCTVVKEKPKVETSVVVNEDGVVYTTEEEATAATKKIKVCSVQ